MTPLLKSLGSTCVLAIGCLLCEVAVAVPTVDLPTTSVSAPQPIGTAVEITGHATDTDSGTISYRFDIRMVGESKSYAFRDFSVDDTFSFTPVEREGDYEFVVIARNNFTGRVGVNTLRSFRFTSLVQGRQPSIRPMANPLVALFSAPPCPAGGSSMRAKIVQVGTTAPVYTNPKPCRPGQNLTFLIAGMRAATLYRVSSETSLGRRGFEGGMIDGPALDFRTGTPPVEFPSISVVNPHSPADDGDDPFILLSVLGTTGFVYGVDLSGMPIWYYQDKTTVTPLLTRPLPGGNLLLLAAGENSSGTGMAIGGFQVLREVDLAGGTVRETNTTRVAEQLSAKSGISSTCQLGGTDCLLGAFSHDAIRLPNGHTLALAIEEKIFTDGTQGSSATNPVDIIGDIIVDLDADFQLSWYWRAFDHLDPHRAAILGETCVNTQEGCKPVILTAGAANDWLHGNAIQFEPEDGSVLYSSRHQDWILKIDYGNGHGTKRTLWKLGKDGDFAINSSDTYPWFSHQHDPGYLRPAAPGGRGLIALFDNGNTRVAAPPLGEGFGHSRGYVMEIDERNKTVSPILLADLGFFSMALGTAERLSSGDWEFEAGWTQTTPINSQSIEVHANDSLGLTLQVDGHMTYRCFRMKNLYTPQAKD